MIVLGIITPGISFAQVMTTSNQACSFPISPTSASDWTPSINCIYKLFLTLQDKVTQLEARIAKLESGTTPTPTPIPTPQPTATGCTCPVETGACVCPPTATGSGATTGTVSKGESGTSVRVIQELLKAEGSFTYPTATGYFGTVTQDAVKAFQSKNGLQASGVVDQSTLQKMEASAAKVAPSLQQNIKALQSKTAPTQ